jgi:hypothetical protein
MAGDWRSVSAIWLAVLYGDRDQPAARVARLAVGRLLHRGGEQGFLGGILAQVELAVSVPADQRAEDLRREFTLLFGRLCAILA